MKFLKNTILVFAVIAAMFACNPLEDTYEELDEQIAEAGADAGVTVNYELIEDDYSALASSVRAMGTVEDSMKADFIEQYLAFNTSIEVSDLLEEMVNENYPQLKKGAAVRVTYNMLEGEDFEDPSQEYVNSLYYRLDEDDYAMVSDDAGSYGFFDREVDIMSVIPMVLDSSIQDPVDGDIVTASFETIGGAYSELTGEVVYSDNFDDNNIDEYETFDLEGPQSWGADESFGDTYAIMSGFDNGEVVNRDWMVSGEIDLTEKEGSITLNMEHIYRFQGDSEWGTHIRVVYATDYAGDVEAATWVDVEFDELPPDSWDAFMSTADISDAAGNTIHLGFYYESTLDFAPNWRVTNLSLEAGAAPETDVVNLLYQYDGDEWESLEDEAYYLGSADYDAMGAPGRFDNFSDSDAPEDYLPTFLADMFPFAQEGDEYIMVYRYFSGSTSTRGNVYTFTDGTWTPAINEDQLTKVTSQYVHTGEELVFNPSVTFTLVSADYQIIVDEVAKTRPELINSFGTGEDLHGADAFFENFDTRLSSRLETDDDTGEPLQPEYTNLSETEALALIDERLTEGLIVLLEAKYSDATTIEGIDILYSVTYATYDGTDGTGTQVFLLTGTGTFEPYEVE